MMQRLSVGQFRRALSAYRCSFGDRLSGLGSRACKGSSRRASGCRDLEFFARAYFPHYLAHACTDADVHVFLYRRLASMTLERGGVLLSIAAPRGEGKSTIVSLIFVLWRLLYGYSRYALLFSDSYDQAVSFVEAIKTELMSNKRIAVDFPLISGRGIVWRRGVIVTRDGRKVEGLGSGKRVRGLRHGPHRPDLVVLDDIENDGHVSSAAQRDKLEDWLHKAVLSLGAVGGGLDVVLVGTVLHGDSVLSRCLRSPSWEGRVCRAIRRFPDRMDLWDAWEDVARNEGTEAAERFYCARSSEMEVGGIVSWPGVRSLKWLMDRRLQIGRSAFASEYLNDPMADGEAFFGRLTFWSDRPRGGCCFGSVDPSLGRGGRDPSAVLVGCLCSEDGGRCLYVLESQISRRTPDRLISEIISAQKRHGCTLWFVEATQFQEFFRTELMKRASDGGVALSARGVLPRSKKELRIESLQPLVEGGRIRFHRSQRQLLEQLHHFPKSAHDDGLDALEMLWRGSVGAGSFCDVVTGRRIAGSGLSGWTSSLSGRRSDISGWSSKGFGPLDAWGG